MSEPRRTRRPIAARIRAQGEEAGAEARSGAALREAFSRWASGVTVVAVRDEATVYAITATAFLPVSIDPPLVLVSINPNATVLPFLQEGAGFGVSILAEDQRRLASIFADTGPLAQMHFPREGDPVLPDALAAFTCRVARRHLEGDHTLVIGEVARVETGPDRRPLIYFRREYGVGG
ncbi:MAG TPA: flavin reductase family protein [Longimicrobiales bacterium]